MTGGGPVQEQEQPWATGTAGANRRPWSRTQQSHDEFKSQQPNLADSYHHHTSFTMLGRADTIDELETHTRIIIPTLSPRTTKQATSTNDTSKNRSNSPPSPNAQESTFNKKDNKGDTYLPLIRNPTNDNYCDFNSSTRLRAEREVESQKMNPAGNSDANGLDDEEDEEVEDESVESLSEALLAVASAEEYAAKIFKLQQACLTPLKEDLADWLNKIMNMSTITSENFMHKLDNGVIICRLAKIISIWCEQQLSTNQQLTDPEQELSDPTQQATAAISGNTIICAPHLQKANLTSTTYSHNYPQKLSTSISNVHSQLTKNNSIRNMDSYDHFRECSNTNASTTPIPLTPTFRPQPRARIFTSLTGPLKSASQSTNCIASLSTNSSLYLSSPSSTDPFLDNLIKMIQTKIWEDAKCRTFYARDNVSNFLRWTRGFGVNQSVLFESDDLVLHANPRQVVLCLLDVARIACVKHGFTEAPGLVKFEQEIDRELAAERAAAAASAAAAAESNNDIINLPSEDGYNKSNDKLSGGRSANQNGGSSSKKLSSRNGESATEELIIRYCKHKEEEAARKRAAAELADAQQQQRVTESSQLLANRHLEDDGDENGTAPNNIRAGFDPDSLLIDSDAKDGELDQGSIKSSQPPALGDAGQANAKTLPYECRVDSLDSGEGRTESASTGHSRTPPVNSDQHHHHHQATGVSAIPVPIKRSESNLSLTTSSRASSIATSELSSSRSSLLSNQDSTANANKRHITSDLDGKVMRIAKSYYGKGAKRGVTRLSEGKYKIADRIVFVRLLKGHRVMVRIGGGWDTLENFLFRHKSDPSQVIDVDNLLPLETKMSFQKSPSSHGPATPNGRHQQHYQQQHSAYSRLPYYRRSSSASSTNLSTSNLSVSNHSPTSVGTAATAASSISTSQAICTPVRRTIGNPPPSRQKSLPEVQPAAIRQQQQQTTSPYFLIHRGGHQQNPGTTARQQQLRDHFAGAGQQQQQHHRAIGQMMHNKVGTPPVRKLSAAAGRNQRPLGNSKTPTASSTNLYPATLTTRIASARPFEAATNLRDVNGLSAANLRQLNERSSQKQEAFRRLGQSNDSLQVSYLRTPRNYGNSNRNNAHLLHNHQAAVTSLGGKMSASPKYPAAKEARS